MGGGPAGEMASEAVREALWSGFDPGVSREKHPADPVERAVRAIREANDRILREARKKHWVGTGTTVVTLVWSGSSPRSAVVLHAGDSRAYRWRQRRLQQLTLDHSLATSARLMGLEEASTLFQGVITRAVGIDEDLEIERTAVEVEPGDLLMLCSDGLTNALPDTALAVMFADHPPDGSLERLAARLIEAANAAGGEDNISVVLVGVGPLPRH